jgi:hypothetical protein
MSNLFIRDQKGAQTPCFFKALPSFLEPQEHSVCAVGAPIPRRMEVREVLIESHGLII